MKKFTLTAIITISLTITSLLNAQNIELYGFGNDSVGGAVYISTFYKVDPFTANANIVNYLEEIEGIAQGSATFDYNLSNYIFYGIDTSSIHRFYSIDTLGNIISNSQALGVTVCGLQYDMQSQNLYGIITDTSTNTKSLGIINPNNASINLINVLFNEPVGIIKGVTFNSNSGKYIFIGADTLANKNVYFVNAQNGIVENDFSVNHCYLGELQFDNLQNKLYGIYRDTALANTLKYFVEIDTLTGAISVINTLNELYGVIGGSSVYDQNTGTFIFEGEDTLHVKRLYLINTTTGGIISNSPLNNHVVDFQCDNTKFAKSFYTSIKNEKTIINDFAIYPNPSQEVFTLNFTVENPQNINIQIVNNLGQIVFQKEHKNYKGRYSNKIDISSFANGVYILNIRTGENTHTENITVLH